MKMLKAGIAISLTTFFFSSPFASAGDKAGNGGGAFICTNSRDSEILDLFEARLGGLKLKASSKPTQTQIEEALARFNPSSNLYKRMTETLTTVQSAKKIPVPAGFDLAWPSDAKNKYAKRGCQAKSVILFSNDNNSMDFDMTAFKQLPETQQAALIVHETVYKFLRETVGEPDSVRARKIVGHLFAVETQSEFNKAVAEIADFYPMALPRLSAQPNELNQNGLKLIYPASYIGEPMKLRVSVKLEPSADKSCTLDDSHSTTSDWSFSQYWDSMDFTHNYCRGQSDGETVVVPACPSTPTRTLPFIQGHVRVSRFEGNGRKQKRVECPARVTLSDPFGSSFSIVVQSPSVYSSFDQEMAWELIAFPSRQFP